MNGPAVLLTLEGGPATLVPVGGLIGRSAASSMRILDPRVSEAHAMVVLRGRELRLLSLRSRVAVDDREDDDVTLAPGQRIVLGGAVTCVVQQVSMPAHVLAVAFAGQQRELCADAYSFLAGPVPDLLPRLVPGASAHLWSADEGWLIQPAGAPAAPLRVGAEWTIDGVDLTVQRVALGDAAGLATVGPREALRLVCRTTTVHVHRARREPIAIDARAGQLLSELALMRAPVEWMVIAAELWPDERDAVRLRRNFDAVLSRLRARLREGGIRDDLVRTDGRGNIEVLLDRSDEVVDEA
jgi:hypothetical protein